MEILYWLRIHVEDAFVIARCGLGLRSRPRAASIVVLGFRLGVGFAVSALRSRLRSVAFPISASRVLPPAVSETHT